MENELMEGAAENVPCSATISCKDTGVEGDSNEIFSVSGVIGTSAAASANKDFADDVIISPKPLKDGMLVENVFIKLGTNKEEPGMVADSIKNLEAAPEATDDGA